MHPGVENENNALKRNDKIPLISNDLNNILYEHIWDWYYLKLFGLAWIPFSIEAESLLSTSAIKLVPFLTTIRPPFANHPPKKATKSERK